MTLEEFFFGFEQSFALFNIVRSQIEQIGTAEMRVQKSQVSFRRLRPFAWLWIPAKVLHRESAPLVLTLGFRHRDSSPRWKEIVEPYPGRFTHHLELYSSADIDNEVKNWLRSAWNEAD